jgi:hypothetical protein
MPRGYEQWIAQADMWGPEEAAEPEPQQHNLALPDPRDAAIIAHVRNSFPSYEADERLSEFVAKLLKGEEAAPQAIAAFERSKWLFADRGVKFVPEKSRPSLSGWLKSGISLQAVSAFVSMSHADVASKGILWTRSLGGCLGVSAWKQAGKAFLAHFDPTEFKSEESMGKALANIEKNIARGASMVLCSMALKAPYVTQFKALALKAGFVVTEEAISDRLAINVDTGQTATNFNVDELTGKK